MERRLPLDQGQCENTLKGHDGGVKSVVFSSDGTKIASRSLASESNDSVPLSLKGKIDEAESDGRDESKTNQTNVNLKELPLNNNSFGRLLWVAPDLIFSCEGMSVLDPVNLNANNLLLLKQRGATTSPPSTLT
eukprot:TRINITY_DN140_c0_g1_i10.p1 TRINITY_DN140_c0_g1~~TRINITY_DN140_c0_g1_i10.p1  ORF type:complete len:151 (+),score=38.65 TRINITY_DN140_c0_g1_i10:54-455(+)